MKAPSKNYPRPFQRHAFTLTELLVVLSVVGIVGTIAINALQSAARAKVESVQCINNHKQLIAVALLYSDEFNGLWFPNQTGDTDWVNNQMSFSPANSDNTNTLKLLNPQFSKFAPYINGDPKLFHCPSDHSYILGSIPIGYRVRSVAANAAVGTVWTATGCLVPNGPVNAEWLTGNNIGTGCQTTWSCYAKTSDFVLPGPGMTWIFTDDHPDDIAGAQLPVQAAQSGIGASFIGMPGNYHDRSAPFAYADGHTEMHRWTGPILGENIIYWSGPPGGRTGIYTVQTAADNNDLIWLQKRTSAHR
ncbi:MAG TPA: type II secretion system protein [Verrucomicrobiae bacterium]|nr:type II secretion system protein [Verrucomicrobiae bacterium]